MKETKYSLLDLRNMYARFLVETKAKYENDCIPDLMPKEFIIWIEKQEASIPSTRWHKLSINEVFYKADIKPIVITNSVEIDRGYIRKVLIPEIIAALKIEGDRDWIGKL